MATPGNPNRPNNLKLSKDGHFGLARNVKFQWGFETGGPNRTPNMSRNSSLSSTYPESPSSPSGRLSHRTNSRQQALASLQSLCSRAVMESNSKFTANSFCQLFSKNEVHQLLFKLFDDKSKGRLVQSQFIDFLNEKLGREGREFVNSFDTTAYVTAGEADLDLQLFSRILQNQKLLSKLFKLIDFNGTKNVSVQSVIVFIMDLSLPRKSSKNNRLLRFESIDELFSSTNGRTELTLDDFKKIIPSKDAFFAERVFHILDKDGSRGISTSELRLGLEQLCSQSAEDRVRFLFQIYDGDGDGLIQLHDLRSVLRACTEENKMNFSDEQLDQLALALYEDAVNSVDDGNISAVNGLEFEHLKAQLEKHPGLIDELSFSLERFLLPSTVPRVRKSRWSASVFWSYLRNNAAFLAFLVAFLFVNIALFASRAYQYRQENPAYIVARACGQVLNFNCAFVVVLMLHHCITWIRQTKLAVFLPLDQHVYLHKLCGFTIVFFGTLHTAMHMINFSLNIANELVSPVTNQTHSAEEWLFTTIPGLFGLIPGVANLTGWGLCVILGVMIPCSLPFVRKTGYFELFYWTHFLHYPFWALLILHGPHFWYWLVGPGALFIILEKLLRLRNRMTGKGRTFINYAILLPSSVTHIVCRKPPNFNFHAGDYVYLNIPAIASYEWHPFTISSAPELPDLIWFHIRGVGGWTNKLYEYFKREQIKQREFEHHSLRPASLFVSSNQSVFQTNVSLGNQSATIASAKNTTENQPPFGWTKTRRPYNPQISITLSEVSTSESPAGAQSVAHTGYRYMRHPPEIINLPVPIEDPRNDDLPHVMWKKINRKKGLRDPFGQETLRARRTNVNKQVGENGESSVRDNRPNGITTISDAIPDPTQMVEGVNIYLPLEITMDGPYGTPSSHIFRAQHAVLIAAGIGVTPYASILQSIMHRYYTSLQKCPNCRYSWANQMPESIMNLKKVDFFWINRDQRSFEWFVHVLSQLEMEQVEMDSALGRFLDLHMYITSALKKTDLKAVGLQMALDLLYAEEKRDLVTGLKTRTNAGRPNWDKVFQKLVDEDKGNVTVFYCGPPELSKVLKKKCNKFGFNFHKEIF
ncbi:NADPH oxidase 5-like isoform X1 [Daphnia pulicaria]|uniref:NADPH oxidase 5-like isoform X1 n=2 Tax=Daphnia pulicaria TaxID=35523 RepID=UPI001EEBE555|nr:NADPH oxidase 5-like isoform X1 [Daphnia pulicaria]